MRFLSLIAFASCIAAVSRNAPVSPHQKTLDPSDLRDFHQRIRREYNKFVVSHDDSDISKHLFLTQSILKETQTYGTDATKAICEMKEFMKECNKMDLKKTTHFSKKLEEVEEKMKEHDQDFSVASYLADKSKHTPEMNQKLKEEMEHALDASGLGKSDKKMRKMLHLLKSVMRDDTDNVDLDNIEEEEAGLPALLQMFTETDHKIDPQQFMKPETLEKLTKLVEQNSHHFSDEL